VKHTTIATTCLLTVVESITDLTAVEAFAEAFALPAFLAVGPGIVAGISTS
jgi:hypothetical protein